MFTTLIVQPIFNLLVLIYALLPGHNFGLSILLFTVIVRFIMWPLVKKQLHHAKAMRQLQPELKRIKQAAKGNKQQESLMTMELYKERQINPFASIGIVLVQLPILIGLYSGISRIVHNPQALVDFSYPFIRNLSWMRQLAGDIGKFDGSLFGIVDLIRPALNKGGGIYWPAMLLVIGSAASQYFQSKQLMPTDKKARSLRRILSDTQTGEAADQAEVSAAVGRGTKFLIPGMIFLFTVNIASALSLYWLVSGVTAYLQQRRVLGQDETELEAIAARPGKKTVIEGEVVSMLKAKSPKSKAKKRKKR